MQGGFDVNGCVSDDYHVRPFPEPIKGSRSAWVPLRLQCVLSPSSNAHQTPGQTTVEAIRATYSLHAVSTGQRQDMDGEEDG